MLETLQTAVERPSIVGMGNIGRWFEAMIQKAAPTLKVLGLDKEDPAVEMICREDSDAVILALSASQQETVGAEIIRKWLSSDSNGVRTVVTVNSLQGGIHQKLSSVCESVPRREPSILICLHPYHSPKQAGGSVDCAWILTNVSVFNVPIKRDREAMEAEITRMIQHFVEDMLPDLACADGRSPATFYLVDLREPRSIQERKLTGPQLHDLIVAYSQAPVHMVRILEGINGSPWWNKHFGGLTDPIGFSQSMAESTPFAKAVNDRLHELLDEDFSLISIQRAVVALLDEAERIIPPEFRNLKTPNVAKLERICRRAVFEVDFSGTIE